MLGLNWNAVFKGLIMDVTVEEAACSIPCCSTSLSFQLEQEVSSKQYVWFNTATGFNHVDKLVFLVILLLQGIVYCYAST